MYDQPALQSTSPPLQGGSRAIILFDTGMESIVRVIASALLVFEVVLLFIGVVFRYALHQPIVWSDELASIVFLWLAMFGSCLAFQRSQHMRMSSLSGAAKGRQRQVLDCLAIIVPIVAIVSVLHHAYEFAIDEIEITTPALGLSNIWRAAAVPIGLGLMLVAGILKLAQMKDRVAITIGLSIVVATAVTFYLGKPYLASIGKWNLLIFFVGLVGVGIAAGIPIAFTFMIATIAFLAFTSRLPLTIVVSRMDEGMSHLILLAIPLFILLGYLMEATGIAAAMLRFLSGLLGHVRGGLSYVLIGAMYLVSGISGSKTADMAAVAPGLVPEMRDRGEKPGDLTALLAATGAQTETIPPSLALIAISSAVGVSTAALFTGGFVPGLVMGVILCGYVWWRNRSRDMPTGERVPRKEVWKAFVVALPALALPFIIRTAVAEGAATATEVSTIGIAYVLVISLFLYQRLTVRRFITMLAGTAALSGAILFVVGAATAMAWALTQSGFSRDLAQFMTHLPGGVAAFMVVSILIFVVVGAVLEGIPAIVLLTPLLMPIAKSIGIHEVHYSMVAILSMGIGYFAPPLGIGYYTACAIAGVHPDQGIRPMMRYIVALFIGLAIVAAFPWFSIGLLK